MRKSLQIVFYFFLVAISLSLIAEEKGSSIYQIQDFSHLLGMDGISDETLKAHFKLYQGYVHQANLLSTLIAEYGREGKERTPQYQEIKRRLSWEFDGMRLHELYFSNLSKETLSIDSQSALVKAIERDFQSFENWKKDFIATGLIRGIGWVVLYQDLSTGKLTNIWIGEHNIGELAGGMPILIMDVWEHAYLLDYKLDREKYIDAFFNHVNWNVVSNRYRNVPL